MSMLVRFSRNGFYHPAFGRLGMGDNAGKVYTLPDDFRAKGMLPKSAEILDEVTDDVLEEILDETGQKEIEKPAIDRDELARAVAAAKGQSRRAKRRPGVKLAGEAASETPSAAAEAPSETSEAAPRAARSRTRRAG